MSLSVADNRPVLRIKYHSVKELRDHFQNVIDVLKLFHGAKCNFVNHFLQFRSNRLQCMLLQTEIADKLDKHHKNCNTSSIVASCVGIIGGVTAIGGLGILTVLSGGIAAPALVAAAPAIAAAGGISGAAGGITLFGTHMTEFVIEKKAMNSVKKLLEDDKIQGEKILKWMERSDEVLIAVDKIMDYSILKKILNYFKINVDKYDQLINNPQEIIEELKLLIDELPISKSGKENLKTFFSDIFSNEVCLELFLQIAALLIPIVPILQIIFNNIDFALKTFRFLDATVDVGNVVVNAVRLSRPTSKLLIAAGFLSAVGVAIDLYALIATSRDMAKGSKSKMASKIRDCVMKMNQELDVLEKMYNGLLCTDYKFYFKQI